MVQNVSIYIMEYERQKINTEILMRGKKVSVSGYEWMDVYNNIDNRILRMESIGTTQLFSNTIRITFSSKWKGFIRRSCSTSGSSMLEQQKVLYIIRAFLVSRRSFWPYIKHFE